MLPLQKLEEKQKIARTVFLKSAESYDSMRWTKIPKREELSFLNKLRITGQIFFSGGICQFWTQKLSSGKGTLLGERETSKDFFEELEAPGSPWKPLKGGGSKIFCSCVLFRRQSPITERGPAWNKGARFWRYVGREVGELNSKPPKDRIKPPTAHRLRQRTSRLSFKSPEGSCLRNEDETKVDRVFIKLDLIPNPAQSLTSCDQFLSAGAQTVNVEHPLVKD